VTAASNSAGRVRRAGAAAATIALVASLRDAAAVVGAAGARCVALRSMLND